MFIVTRSWGEYSDRGECCICACETEADAKKVVNLMKLIDAYNKEQSLKFKEAIADFKKSLNIREYPDRPHKTTIDPCNLITQNAWMNQYLKPWNDLTSEVHKHNGEMDIHIANFKCCYPREVPEEFKLFAQHVVLHEYGDYERNYYSIEEIEVVKFD
jgi:hypothetical protein